MTQSFDLPAPDRFTTGAIGEPGQRTFFVQGTGDGVTVTLKLEKTQVAALAQYIAELLADLQPVPDNDVPVDLDLVEPAVAEWVVGTIGVAFDEPRDRLVVTFQELQPIDPDAPDAIIEPDDDVSAATFMLTRAQAMAFVRRAAELVSAG
ncbi:MAG: hypothetical protein QOI47_2347, partial [Actinomycetota bacterium]|nr:hypothetical protein [Actinomycetota bacterium]